MDRRDFFKLTSIAAGSVALPTLGCSQKCGAGIRRAVAGVGGDVRAGTLRVVIACAGTPTLIGEDWLMNNGYMQAEGVANLDLVPATGALIAIGFPRFKGGTGGFVSFTPICPADWTHGVRPGDAAEAPLAYNEKRLAWNDAHGVRERTAPCDKPKGKLSFNP